MATLTEYALILAEFSLLTGPTLTEVGTSKSNLLLGTSGDDVISGDANSITLIDVTSHFKVGNDTIFGNGGMDIIYGDTRFLSAAGDGAGSKVFLGNDSLNASGVLIGDASFFGMGNAQHYSISMGNDLLTGTGFLLGDSGLNILINSSSNVLTYGNDTIDAGQAVTSNTIMGDTLHFIIDATSHNNLFYMGNDILMGGSGGDVLGGDAAFLRIQGSGNIFALGNDSIHGGMGNDTISPDLGVAPDIAAGNTVVGGNDTIWGGGGTDSFFFTMDPHVPLGHDIIMDFEAGETLQFSGVVDAGASGLADDFDANLAFSVADNGHDVTMSFGPDSQVVLAGMGNGLLQSFEDLMAAGVNMTTVA